jgi:hypothetical protein
MPRPLNASTTAKIALLVPTVATIGIVSEVVSAVILAAR